MTEGSANQVVFRADASVAIGVGHVVRCLSLAEVLTGASWRCGFACNADALDVVPALTNLSHNSLVLDGDEAKEPAALAAHWPAGVDWLVVDHYRRSGRFERACRPWAKRVMVIDDLANRPHDCDLLLDQTLGRTAGEYELLVPPRCRVLCGPEFALLRPQFAAARSSALARRQIGGSVHRILVSVGSVDPDNVTAKVLTGIWHSKLDADVDIVLGANAAHFSEIREQAARLPFKVAVHTSVTDMARLMIAADLAIGGCGSSSWERSCLGLPTLVLIIADNQVEIAKALDRQQLARVLGWHADIDSDGIATALVQLCHNHDERLAMCEHSAAICDGRGTERVLEVLAR